MVSVDSLIGQASSMSKAIAKDKLVKSLADEQGIKIGDPAASTQAVISQAFARVKQYSEMAPEGKPEGTPGSELLSGGGGDNQQIMLMMLAQMQAMQQMMVQMMMSFQAMFSGAQPQMMPDNPVTLPSPPTQTNPGLNFLV